MELITIRTFQNYFSAHILLTKLKSAGIECYLKDEATVTMGPFLSNAVGGIKLVIKKSDENEVATLLEQLDDDFKKSAVCPKCGSNEIDRRPKKNTVNLFSIIISWLTGDMAISLKNVYHCSSCNYESDTFTEPFHPIPVYEGDRLN
ncbi:MAG: hypothetical protein ABI266_05380 [Ginsengibacter sp.]